MAATTGNTHIEDGMEYTQETCDAYLAEIQELEGTWEWRSGVVKAWTLRRWQHDGTNFTTYEDSDATIDGHPTYAGAHFFLPHWRTGNPDVTEITSDPRTHSYGQWDLFTNNRATWDAQVDQLRADIDIMKATHVEMLATVD